MKQSHGTSWPKAVQLYKAAVGTAIAADEGQTRRSLLCLWHACSMRSDSKIRQRAELRLSRAQTRECALDPTVADLVKYLAEVWAERRFRSIVADTEQPSASDED